MKYFVLFVGAVVMFVSSPLIDTSYAYFGRLATVLSGDTFMLNDSGNEYTIRLYGIDSPDEGQIGGIPSRDYLKNMLKTNDSRITAVPVDGGVDKQGRIQAVVYKDGVCVNENMVREGQAWFYYLKCKIKECSVWKEAELEARSARKGIWAIPGAEEPWIYRSKRSYVHDDDKEGYIEGVYYKLEGDRVMTKDPNEADLFPVFQLTQGTFNFGPQEIRKSLAMPRLSGSNSFDDLVRKKYEILQQQAVPGAQSVNNIPAIQSVSPVATVQSANPVSTVFGTDGQIYTRDPGSGNLINNQSGAVAVPSGPNGYVETRTGKFMPAF